MPRGGGCVIKKRKKELPDGHVIVYEYLFVEMGGECAEDEEEGEEDPSGDECGLGTVGV